jgi:hypothetical protein
MAYQKSKRFFRGYFSTFKGSKFMLNYISTDAQESQILPVQYRQAKTAYRRICRVALPFHRHDPLHLLTSIVFHHHFDTKLHFAFPTLTCQDCTTISHLMSAFLDFRRFGPIPREARPLPLSVSPNIQKQYFDDQMLTKEMRSAFQRS